MKWLCLSTVAKCKDVAANKPEIMTTRRRSVKTSSTNKKFYNSIDIRTRKAQQNTEQRNGDNGIAHVEILAGTPNLLKALFSTHSGSVSNWDLLAVQASLN
ncbi:hypothetical protein WALSEDRAFT_63298 [Wallemia mellicola CBS 633.66]|uniref:Uncharacterized protein n=1 Tax=Wallemia mellicola (strain ATCC MYA-4683 / CBS 633.66) TaxID=671144 RepID=I4YFC3_WALMC|nr:hypothetical protein WALSEDRAFT_63298 [Wallemia mellicola CBS 633.66]EIM22665.1 hypothetical protein WALSEDRAFT_63298 [Wallemia mellicola CBS 633.66]|eukprot:XP_006957330.1 hypothetical protein WALSEDRAFT_63298 [Wallemia mellicola CBS 633.66]